MGLADPGGRVNDGLKGVRYHGVSAFGGVLIPLGRDRGGVAQSGHQFALGGALLRRQGPGRVAQVVEVDAALAGGVDGPLPRRIEGGATQAIGERAGEDGIVGGRAGVPVEVLGQSGAHRRGYRDAAPAGVGLRCGDDPVAVLELDRLHLDTDLGRLESEVLAAQAEKLAEAQATEAGQEDQGPVAVLDGIG